jgi:hypothetical protein
MGVVFAFVALTGLYVFAVDLFAPGYFPVLAAHIAVGLLLAVVVPVGLGAHLKRTSSPGVKSVLPVVLLLAIPAVLVEIALAVEIRGSGDVAGRRGGERAAAELSYALWGTDNGDGAMVEMAAELATLLALLAALLAWRLRERQPSVPVRWTGVLASAALILAVTTGLAAWLGRGDARFDVLAAHSVIGLLTVVMAGAHFKAPRRILGRGWGSAVLVGTTLAVVLAWTPLYRAEHRFRVEDDLEAGPRGPRDLHADGSDQGAPIPEELLLGSEGCGDAGCHEVLTDQWKGSAHRFSSDNALYRAVIDQLVRERGAGEARFCAGCHDPVRALAGTVEAAYADGAPPPGDGVSCVVCHILIAPSGSPKNGDAAYRAPVPYPGKDRAVRSARIKLDPRYHRMTMTSDITVHPEVCGTCHRLELGPFMGAAITTEVQNAYVRRSPSDHRYDDTVQFCSDCHLPAITRQGRGLMPLYDHQMVGINLDLPSYVTHPDADAGSLGRVLERTREMVRGSTDDGRVFPPPPFVDEWPDASAAPGVLAVGVVGDRRGSSLTVTVTTQNHRIGHAFPIGPFDLREVWQRIVVRDGSGATVATVGGRGEDGRVDPEAHRLGAVELDRAGDPLRRHRIWDVAEVRDKRLIPRAGAVTDDYLIALPEGTVGPLTVEAVWLLRRTNLEFSRFVFGEDHPGFEVHEVARGLWSEGASGPD